MRKLPVNFFVAAVTVKTTNFKGEILETLLQPRTARDRDKTGKTALHYCAENQNINCIDQVCKNIACSMFLEP